MQKFYKIIRNCAAGEKNKVLECRSRKKYRFFEHPERKNIRVLSAAGGKNTDFERRRRKKYGFRAPQAKKIVLSAAGGKNKDFERSR